MCLLRALNSIQPIVGTRRGLDGASSFPFISTFGDALLEQGPAKMIGPTKNVPSGIRKVVDPPCAHAALQASENAYHTEHLSHEQTSCINVIYTSIDKYIT